ncbi:MAG: YgfZ/GcvT domain-containing protein, partial [Solirubrobacteraceae bacterium]
MPGTSIDSLDGEYQTLTEACGLLDRSERGKLALSGAGAVEFLNGQVTNELATLRAGEGRYAAFLTPKGKMLGDLRILAVGSDRQAPPSELLLDTERVALQALFDMIRRYRVGYDVQLHKHTLERGLISLVGPESAVVAGAVVPGDAGDGSRVEPADDEHANAPVEIDGIACLAVRTDTGVDLICEATATERLLQALRGRGASPVSEQATECLRVERGR